MNPFSERKNILRAINTVMRPARRPDDSDETVVCRACGASATKARLRENLYVCPYCGFHGKMNAAARIRMIADDRSFREMSGSLQGPDPLKFPGYMEKIKEAQAKTGMKEAVITGTCMIGGIKAVICVMDAHFMMASMGMAVGEKITRAAEFATKKKLPLIIFAASGGARMQEGMLSLMQMAKTSAAVAHHGEESLLYICMMTNPTTGGVTASFASLADIILAEPGALIGFAGQRVIEQTIGEKLPDGFQSAEFQEEHGFVDAVVPRDKLRFTLHELLLLHRRDRR